MGLETGTYISDLNPLNPNFDDLVREADDHMRFIKEVLKNTLPNAAGAMPITGDGSNLIVQGGLTVTGSALLGNYLFDTDQVLGPGVDTYALTYDNLTGLISLSPHEPVWGNITGTLANQTDLQTALNLKANLAAPAFTGNMTWTEAGSSMSWFDDFFEMAFTSGDNIQFGGAYFQLDSGITAGGQGHISADEVEFTSNPKTIGWKMVNNLTAGPLFAGVINPAHNTEFQLGLGVRLAVAPNGSVVVTSSNQIGFQTAAGNWNLLCNNNAGVVMYYNNDAVMQTGVNGLVMGLVDTTAKGIHRQGPGGSLFISGGSSQTNGARITMFGATAPGLLGNDMAFGAGSDDDWMNWDDSAGTLEISTGIGATKTSTALFNTTQVSLGNFVFDTDQVVGAGTDEYVLTYDFTGGQISLKAATGGGGGWTVVTETTTTRTAAAGEYILADDDTAAGDITVTLPAAATAGSGAEIGVKRLGSNEGRQIIIDGNGAELIDGLTTFSIAVQYESITLVCDGTGWHIT